MSPSTCEGVEVEIGAVGVSAFKSLYDLNATLEHLSVVTGPNGSGKSNLVDALTFLSDTYRHGLEFAVSRAGGYENIAHRRTRRAKRAISFSVEVSLSSSDLISARRGYFWRNAVDDWPPGLGLIVRHSFSFRASSQRLLADFEVVDEALEIFDEARVPLVDVRRVADEVRVGLGKRHPKIKRSHVSAMIRPFSERGFNWEGWGRPPAATDLIFAIYRFLNIFEPVAEHLSGIRVFQLSPHLSRASGVATPSAELGLHGENLPGAADNLRRRGGKAWTHVEDAMRTIMPGLVSIDVVPTEDRRLAVQFREKGVGRPWNASEVSDGTIQTFALLVALFDPRGSMLIIEEPENAVHPWILRHLLSLTQAGDRQILLTTHSPVVLNYVDPSIVWLMWLREGRSTLHRFVNLDPELTRGLVDGSLSVFETYDSGLFKEAIPRGFTDYGALEP